MIIGPDERIHYAGHRWRAIDEKTLKELRRAMEYGTFAKVFAIAALEGRMVIDEDA